jgi:hypothetical protein
MNGILPGNARFVRKLSKNGQKFANTVTGTLPDNNNPGQVIPDPVHPA